MVDFENDRIGEIARELCLIPGLSGHEGRVSAAIRKHLESIGLDCTIDILGNLHASIEGDGDAPSVLLFAHADQLGGIVRKIESDGRILFDRVGGLPEKSLPAQRVVITTDKGNDILGFIANKSHHATDNIEKYSVLTCKDLYIDAGFESSDETSMAGIRIGCPVVYLPWCERVGGNRLAGTSIDDRAGCAVILEVARVLATRNIRPTVHFLFSVQEEYNLRGVLPAARKLNPDVAIQIDLILAADTPDMVKRGEVRLGGGPAISMFSFHGRGTLNGVIPHPGLVRLIERSARTAEIPLQRSAHIGALTDLSYIQFLGEGVACVDVGFPMRYSHSAAELCDLRDLSGLAKLLTHALTDIRGSDLERSSSNG
ncbi:MAG: M20/M25/M40 family metallo-hydrolase [Albidovulum sp.]|nr:M20/M25/M40 family metallo-hydrolase [Albidovulum sp.]